MCFVRGAPGRLTRIHSRGGLFHFRDAISRGNPQHIYVSNGDSASCRWALFGSLTWTLALLTRTLSFGNLPHTVACHLPLEEMRDFHLKHGTVCTMMGVRVSKDASTKYGCVVIDEETQHARHYVEKPSEFISNTINGGIYLFDGKAIFDELKHAADLKAELTAPFVWALVSVQTAPPSLTTVLFDSVHQTKPI